MSNEKMKILEMLQAGTITVEDADKLLETLGESQEKEMKQRKSHLQSDGKRMQGKKLKVEVDGDSEDDEEIHVNVSVPLILARYADNILNNCIPQEANDAMQDKGINLRGLNISEIVETFDTLEEDIVNVELGGEGNCMKVRVYVE